jgi:hypothetical protein
MYHIPIVFGIELRREFGRIDEVAEHDRELPSFRVGRRLCSRERCSLRGGLFLGSRLWCWRSRRSGDFLSACRVASPDETPSVVISYRVHVKEFILQVVEVVVIKVEASFQCTIGYASLAFEEVNDLGENVIEGHG